MIFTIAMMVLILLGTLWITTSKGDLLKSSLVILAVLVAVAAMLITTEIVVDNNKYGGIIGTKGVLK